MLGATSTFTHPSPHMVASPAGRYRGKHRSSKSVSSMAPSAKLQQTPTPKDNSFQTPLRASNQNNSAHHQYQNVTPPQTPKIYQSSGNTSATSAKKNKRKQKPRPKDVNIRDVASQETQSTASSDDVFVGPPSSDNGLHTPTKAYAGPNFHSSPAPSSLPVPSFFSKSVPATPSALPSWQPMLETEKAVPSGFVPFSPSSGSSSGCSSGSESESHLERLFRADKEEKERKVRRGSTSSPQTSPGPKSVDLDNTETSLIWDPPETSLFFMDVDKKEQEKAATTTTDQWKAKSDALRSFLHQREPSQSNISTTHRALTHRGDDPYVWDQGQNSTGFSKQPQYPSSRYRPDHKQQDFHATPTKNSSSSNQTRFASPQPPRLMSSAPKGPTRGRQQFVTQSPSPPQRHCNLNLGTAKVGLGAIDRNSNPGDFREMEDYLRRILKLEANSMSSLATSAAAAS